MILYEKAKKGLYLEKYSKNGELLRIAEKIGKTWVIHCYKGKNISGEYTEKEFKEIWK